METGLNYNGARYYDSSIGGFPQPDPTGFDGGIGLYVYSLNNPLSYSDSYGLKPCDPFPNANAAALDALNFTNPISMANNLEYAGLIYSADGSYYSTPPVAGSVDHSDPFNSTARQDLRNAAGMPVGEYHTHGNYSKTVNGVPVITNKEGSEYSDDCFSKQNKDNAKFRAKFFQPYESYLGTPSGNFYQYDPSTDTTSPLK